MSSSSKPSATGGVTSSAGSGGGSAWTSTWAWTSAWTSEWTDGVPISTSRTSSSSPKATATSSNDDEAGTNPPIDPWVAPSPPESDDTASIPSTNNITPESKTLSTGAAVGLAIGATALVILAVVAGVWWLRRRRAAHAAQQRMDLMDMDDGAYPTPHQAADSEHASSEHLIVPFASGGPSTRPSSRTGGSSATSMTSYPATAASYHPRPLGLVTVNEETPALIRDTKGAPGMSAVAARRYGEDPEEPPQYFDLVEQAQAMVENSTVAPSNASTGRPGV